MSTKGQGAEGQTQCRNEEFPHSKSNRMGSDREDADKHLTIHLLRCQIIAQASRLNE